ncbi:MAG: glycosyltransferase family 39 protein [Solirubrobacterales bacterium]|nr:glycosyltransferase family 39 protein [Solirubrobacterales bacterium]MBV9717074.1 glycosyltransferase family 39 protein [Solirubrobacterales bacterium]
MVARVRNRAPRPQWLPVALLATVTVLSVAARAAWLGAPCRSPCRTAADHVLIFDEDYYVNAARVIAGIRPPAGAPYAHAPLGDDPNAEHPQLAKLVMAGSIELFGDGPLAWRLGSIVFGTAAILGMYALTRAAGGSPWLALGAAALMAADNLMIVHGRIGTLDIYALAAMVWAAALYLRRRPVLSGVVLGVGACAKEVAPSLLLALIVFEALRWATTRQGGRARLVSLGLCTLATAVSTIVLLSVLYRVAPPYADAAGQRVTGGAFGHISHILDYAAHLTSPQGPRGIASYPWWWLGDYKPITYLNINPSRPAPGLSDIHPAVHFLGMISPPILLAGLVGLLVAAGGLGAARRSGLGELGALALAWFLGTFAPFALSSLLLDRTSYLYYMLIVMPSLYLAAIYLLARLRPPRLITAVWLVTVLAAAIVMYPLIPITL